MDFLKIMVKNSFSIITKILTGGFLRILDIIFIGYQLIDGVNFSLLLFFPGSSDFLTLLTRLYMDRSHNVGNDAANGTTKFELVRDL